MQLDNAERGFSFMRDGPLDMRMDSRQKLTAEKIVNEWSEEELAMIIREYGEEPRWKKAGRAIVIARRKDRIRSTTQLATILSQTLKTKMRGRLHPATLVFQALRIAVNHELSSIDDGIRKAIQWLSPNGKIAVMSFHRLEDRIVKNIFRSYSQPKEMKEFFLKVFTKKPIVPSFSEKRNNRRVRSAKLRVAQKIS